MSYLVPELDAFYLLILLSHINHCCLKLRAISCLIEFGIQLFFFLIEIKDLRKILTPAMIYQKAAQAPGNKTT